MAQRIYRYISGPPGLVIKTQRGDSAVRGGTIRLSDGECIWFTHRGVLLEPLHATKKEAAPPATDDDGFNDLAEAETEDAPAGSE